MPLSISYFFTFAGSSWREIVLLFQPKPDCNKEKYPIYKPHVNIYAKTPLFR